MFEISVEKVFAAAHAIRLYDGQLEPVHGHNWEVTVTVARDGLDEIETVMDFHELERLIDTVIEPWRNRHLNEVAPFADGSINPSAERVAWWIGTQVAKHLPEGVVMVGVSVLEAPGCVATWRP